MTGTATITTTTTSVPVTMTELMDAEVMAVAGNAIIVKMNDGFHKFTQEDVNERNITIVREGEKVELHQLRQGDRLTAKVITQKEPKIVTEQDVKAVIDSAASGAASAPAAQGAPAAGSAPSTADPAAEKTGLSTLAWVGIVVLALIVILFLLRRPRKA
jgi:hypothetical protein